MRKGDAAFAVVTIAGNTVLESPLLNSMIELDEIYACTGL